MFLLYFWVFVRLPEIFWTEKFRKIGKSPIIRFERNLEDGRILIQHAKKHKVWWFLSLRVRVNLSPETCTIIKFEEFQYIQILCSVLMIQSRGSFTIDLAANENKSACFLYYFGSAKCFRIFGQWVTFMNQCRAGGIPLNLGLPPLWIKLDGIRENRVFANGRFEWLQRKRRRRRNLLTYGYGQLGLSLRNKITIACAEAF